MAKPRIDRQEMAARAAEVSTVLKTLAHPARLMIVCTLIEGEYSVGDLEAETDIHQPTLSQQLTVLRGAGIVRTRRASKQIFYRLSETKVVALIGALYKIFCADIARADKMEAESAS
jgi:DNA-binding transcriptional ArsR family regulator